MHPDQTPQYPSRPPFVIEHRQVPVKNQGTRFHPEARLFVSETLRTSGLLASLPDREVRNLFWLLTYLHPNGRLFAPVSLLARDMSLSERDVRKQFLALATIHWQGAPLVRHLNGDTTERFTLGNQILGEETLDTSVLLPLPEPTRSTGHREAIVQMSRERYGRPRLEVEKIVLEQLGYHPEENSDTPEGEVRRGLRGVGISREQINELIEEFGIEACLRQVKWLPLRGAKNPSRYVVAAIQENYSPPRGLRPFEPEPANENELPMDEDLIPIYEEIIPMSEEIDEGGGNV